MMLPSGKGKGKKDLKVTECILRLYWERDIAVQVGQGWRGLVPYQQALWDGQLGEWTG